MPAIEPIVGSPDVIPASPGVRDKTVSLQWLTSAIWFQLGSNEGPLNRRFLGISGADSTALRFVNSRMLYR
jgi:hypothetical protein